MTRTITFSVSLAWLLWATAPVQAAEDYSWRASAIGGAANEALKRHIIEAHTPIEEAGQVAHDAGVKKLVLTHFVPSLPAFDKPEIWIRGARKFYDGEIIVGQDLLEIE